jgi:hypothetical protein
MKITFKTNKPTGKWRSFGTTTHDIKYGGNVIGTIDDDKPHKIRLMVKKVDINEDGNPNCDWTWKVIKKEFEDVTSAKKYITDNAESILTLVKG